MLLVLHLLFVINGYFFISKKWYCLIGSFEICSKNLMQRNTRTLVFIPKAIVTVASVVTGEEYAAQPILLSLVPQHPAGLLMKDPRSSLQCAIIVELLPYPDGSQISTTVS
ncbi:hypothetical protein CB1_001428068 [Camelus ferus]|nr:hypothetical protein CB1_001428068 [Camelus ferus]